MKTAVKVAMVVALACGADAAAHAQVVWLVRHAEKADASKDPDLSSAGRARAERLGRMLRDVELSAVYVTHLRRTQQTAAPTVSQRRISPVVLHASDTDRLISVVRSHRAGHDVLVVGHSDTLPVVWAALGCSRPLLIDHAEYDLLLRVDLDSVSHRCVVLRQGN